MPFMLSCRKFRKVGVGVGHFTSDFATLVLTRGVVMKKEVWERRSHTKYKGRLHQIVQIK